MRKYLIITICILFANIAQAANGDEWLKQAVIARRADIVTKAQWAMQQQPVTVTVASSPRSAGGIHDFYSEGDYWWPNPASADSPYIQKDGQTNPDNFVAHRQAMVRFSRVVGALAAAYVAEGKKEYLEHARKHILAWFVNADTRMNPNLQYAQAIKGRATGRGIGIIDTVHFIEIAQALRIMEKAGVLKDADLAAVKSWFAEYLRFMTEHPYGKDEMNAKNNHGTCWVMQVAAFSSFLQDKKWTDFCINRYKEVLLPNQMAGDGSFPQELRRTKPYGYALFNLDAMATVCQILSTPGNDLWKYTADAGKTIGKGIAYMYPYVEDKGKWPFAKDVMYWDEWPVAHPFLLFGAAAYNNENYFRLWQKLKHDPEVEEVLRNLPVRNPEIWMVKL
ncbi:alginate lyase family protein [Chitinophaga barathri]|uniref:Alginate lyase n=1 Tax=Chitinophaga barathri TaxID=1647451 RepID=A0A3N4MM07_9BACT|nr:alginate lyase family protein [Chitinophaga barathri]RPD41090.1 alginate lyase [Chitinophaga barathri]